MSDSLFINIITKINNKLKCSVHFDQKDSKKAIMLYLAFIKKMKHEDDGSLE